MFQGMMHRVKEMVGQVMFRAQRVTEEDLAKQEAQKQRIADERNRAMRASHADVGGAGKQPGAPGAGDGDAQQLNRRQRRQVAAKHGAAAVPQAQPVAQTVKRERPKVGRNDPCWCGSGKKYKNCHFREDRAGAGEPLD